MIEGSRFWLELEEGKRSRNGSALMNEGVHPLRPQSGIAISSHQIPDMGECLPAQEDLEGQQASN